MELRTLPNDGTLMEDNKCPIPLVFALESMAKPDMRSALTAIRAPSLSLQDDTFHPQFAWLPRQLAQCSMCPSKASSWL
jgi:hypothetical protein